MKENESENQITRPKGWKLFFIYYIKLMAYLIPVYLLFAQYMSLLNVEEMISAHFRKCSQSGEQTINSDSESKSISNKKNNWK